MPKDREVRVPKQKRSIEKAEKILQAAYQLFCERGYYKTNTPEIAERAGVSIGCLYSYFTDKRSIFMEIYTRYLKQFEEVSEQFHGSIRNCRDPEQWLRSYLSVLIKIHDDSLDFQKELRVLHETDSEIAAISMEQKTKIQHYTMTFLQECPRPVHVQDFETASIIVTDFMNALVDRIVLYPSANQREQILDEGIRALTRYLFG